MRKKWRLTVGLGAVDAEEVVVAEQQAVAVLALGALADRLAVHARPETVQGT